MPPIAAVPGTHDILPEEAAAWQRLLALHAEVAEGFGYRPADAPILEQAELFERGVGTGTDIVDKEMYTFSDRGGRRLTLRPEGTAGMLRAVLGAHMTQAARPVRVHYAGPMFRADRPQRGRFRQFHQVGIECIGERSPALDVEVIELGVEFLRRLGVEGVGLQVNSLGDGADRARYRSSLLAYYEPLSEQLCEDCRRRLRLNPLRLLDCRRDAALAEGAPHLAESLSAESGAYFSSVLEGLEAAGIAYTRNHRLVRGLDYYAHTTFEFWHGALEGAQNALSGGGRYDGLAAELGFAETPGVGYAMGIERLLLVAPPPIPPAAADVVAIALSAEETQAAASAARLLRARGTRVVVDAGERRLAAKLKAADRLGARFAVIVGEQERADGEVQLRDLRERTQERVRLAQLAERVVRVVAGAVR